MPRLWHLLLYAREYDQPVGHGLGAASFSDIVVRDTAMRVWFRAPLDPELGGGLVVPHGLQNRSVSGAVAEAVSPATTSLGFRLHGHGLPIVLSPIAQVIRPPFSWLMKQARSGWVGRQFLVTCAISGSLYRKIQRKRMGPPEAMAPSQEWREAPRTKLQASA